MNARWVRGPPAPESTGDGDYSNEVDRCEAPVRRSGADGVTGGAGRRGRPRPRPGRRMRATVCKVCHSARRARPSYGVQPVPFRVRPGLPRDAPDGVQGVQCGAPGTPPYGVQAVPFRVRPGLLRDAPDGVQGVQCGAPCTPPYGVQVVPFRVQPGPPRDAPHGVQGVQFGAPCPPPYGVQAVPFRVQPGPPRDAPHGVQGVPFGTPDPPPIRCATCAISGAARTSAGCAPRCARCAIRRAMPRLATDHRRPATVCKVCNSTRQEIGGRVGRDDP